MKTTYYIAEPVHALCRLAGVDAVEVAGVAGVPASYLIDSERGITAQETFALWTALCSVSPLEDLPIVLARRAAQVQIVPTLMAYLLSPTVEAGLRQLALFKGGTGPFIMDVSYSNDMLCVTVECSEKNLSFPTNFGLFEAVYIVELLRLTTASYIKPVSVEFSESFQGAEAFFGVVPCIAPKVALHFTKEDAARTLVSKNDGLLEYLRPMLEVSLERHRPSKTTTEIVVLHLQEQQAPFSCNLSSVASSLGQSQRVLQRALKAEGTSFQAITRKMRMQLAMSLLIQSDDQIFVIAAKLGYKDPNSFFRAFRRFTGLTPNQVRETRDKM